MHTRGKLLRATKGLPSWVGLTVFMQIVNNFGHFNRGWLDSALMSTWALTVANFASRSRIRRQTRHEAAPSGMNG